MNHEKVKQIIIEITDRLKAIGIRNQDAFIQLCNDNPSTNVFLYKEDAECYDDFCYGCEDDCKSCSTTKKHNYYYLDLPQRIGFVEEE